MRVNSKRKGKIKFEIRISRSRVKGEESTEPARARTFIVCKFASTEIGLD